MVTANSVIEEARVARVRELKTALAEAKERLVRVEEERDSILAHFDLALVALHDFEQLEEGSRLQIIDGWNAILRHRNVSKLTSEEISQLKADYLANLAPFVENVKTVRNLIAHGEQVYILTKAANEDAKAGSR